MSFTNFYASPLCAMGRAQLLTGRDFPRTGNLFNTHNGRASGYEPWSRGFNESWLPSEYVHLDNLMRHNGKYVQTKGLMEPALVDRMVNFMQRQQQAKQPFLIYYAPYAVHGIPVGIPNPSKPNASDGSYGPDGAYFNPEPYLSMVRQQLQGLPKPTDEWNLRFWAFLAYFDDVLGQLFNAVAASPWLASSTYIVLTSDNGADIPPALTPYHRLRRMPSGMLGDKSDICEYITRVLHRKCESTGAGGEGAVRTPLVVAGPGVPAGAVSDTLLNLADILPTVAQLAGAAAVNSQHQAWSGRSFANLLVPGGVEDAVQQDRVLFTLAVSAERKLCAQVWDVMTQLLPDLGPDRLALKPQPMLAYVNETGAPLMKACIVARYKEYKWFGHNNQVYRLTNGSHIEAECNKVQGKLGEQIAANFDAAARWWWGDVLAEPNSFNKPVYQVGWQADNTTNIEMEGAVAFQRGSMSVVGSYINFTQPGDYACVKAQVHRPGWHQVITMYQSRLYSLLPAFKLSVGQHTQIQAGTATSLSFTLTKDGSSANFDGWLLLNRTATGKPIELCTQLISIANITDGSNVANRPDNSSWYVLISNTRLIADPKYKPHRNSLAADAADGATTASEAAYASRGSANKQQQASAVPASASEAASASPDSVSAQQRVSAVPSGMPESLLHYSMDQPGVYKNIQPSPALQEMERLVRAAELTASKARNSAAARSSSAAAGGSTAREQAWRELQARFKWGDGQGVFDSLYGQCDAPARVCRATCT
ncbi:hypothetical protein OEZ85_003274 [Tetradesmus obliquus]|uniref:Sulfatase N-terminal domain-containing protein n=1 Tax=Tetradesmus obliquus TaxID=3088 RepID=A0ABY8U057_TETOB|nr:hypothetical protein OEZ85_003274 [Tetradesmus obliquus]